MHSFLPEFEKMRKEKKKKRGMGCGGVKRDKKRGDGRGRKNNGKARTIIKIKIIPSPRDSPPFPHRPDPTSKASSCHVATA